MNDLIIMLGYFVKQRIKQLEKIFEGDRVEYIKELNTFEVLTVKSLIDYEKIKKLDKKGLRLASIKIQDNGQTLLNVDTKDYDFKNVIIICQTMITIMFSLIIMALASKLHLP